MEIIKSRIPEDANIYIAGDLHYGGLNTSRSSIKQFVDDVAAEPNNYCVLLGDSIESILPSDKRWATCSVNWQDRLFTPERQVECLLEDLSPIKGKVLTVLMGNHEYKLINTANFSKQIAVGLDAGYGSAVCKLHLTFDNKKTIKFMLAHGSGSVPKGAKDPIQRDANRRAWLKRRLEGIAGDTIGMFIGHGHHLLKVDPTVESQLYLSDNGKDIKQNYRTDADQSANYIPPESRYYGMCGSFLRLFSPPGSEAVSYGEIALYEPTEIGVLIAYIRGGKMVGLEKVFY